MTSTPKNVQQHVFGSMPNTAQSPLSSLLRQMNFVIQVRLNFHKRAKEERNRVEYI